MVICRGCDTQLTYPWFYSRFFHNVRWIFGPHCITWCCNYMVWLLQKLLLCMGAHTNGCLSQVVEYWRLEFVGQAGTNPKPQYFRWVGKWTQTINCLTNSYRLDHTLQSFHDNKTPHFIYWILCLKLMFDASLKNKMHLVNVCLLCNHLNRLDPYRLKDLIRHNKCWCLKLLHGLIKVYFRHCGH